MNILLAASECSPFVKTGGLADVMGALPKALSKQGHQVKVLLPFYKKIKDRWNTTYLGYTFISLGQHRAYVGVHTITLDEVDYYFIDNNDYFYHDSLYGFGNDGERFSYFSFAILEALRIINFFPDILHLNDWHTGLVPHLLKAKYKYEEVYRNIKTIFTIHNLQYQGKFPKDLASIFDIEYSSVMEYDGHINFMKTALVDADFITTVSPNYRNETLTPEYGNELDSMLRARADNYIGILNGIDVEVFNPETDHFLFKPYQTRNAISGKRENKQALQREVGLPESEHMLVGLVSRLVDQKGIQLLEQSLDEIISHSDIQFVLMGSGDQHYEQYFEYLTHTYPDRVKVYIGYNEAFAQKIYAGVDCFLVPSLFEPCGLSQLIAMRYGTLPLVRETGGLKDTVKPINAFSKEGTGFSFTHFSKEDFKNVLFYAYDVYRFDRKNWNKILKEIMRQDFSWDYSAKEYSKLYERIIKWRN